MAMTRSVGKAFRINHSWMMKIAGFEPTPAEEMPEVPLFDYLSLDDQKGLSGFLNKNNVAEDLHDKIALMLDGRQKNEVTIRKVIERAEKV
jgi:hypothetical protein